MKALPRVYRRAVRGSRPRFRLALKSLRRRGVKHLPRDGKNCLNTRTWLMGFRISETRTRLWFQKNKQHSAEEPATHLGQPKEHALTKQRRNGRSGPRFRQTSLWDARGSQPTKVRSTKQNKHATTGNYAGDSHLTPTGIVPLAKIFNVSMATRFSEHTSRRSEKCFSPGNRAVGGSLRPGCFNVTSCGSREATPARLRFLAELSRCAHNVITPYFRCTWAHDVVTVSDDRTARLSGPGH